MAVGGLTNAPRWLGLVLAGAALVIDQAFKTWMIHGYRIAERGLVEITPFFNLVMVWNYGISYGLFQQDSDLGRFILVGIKAVITIGLLIWLWRTPRLWVAAALGLVIGGAIGNAIDRVIYGAVADFFHFHAYGFSWYVFNLADVAVVAGVGLLLYDSFVNDRGHKGAANAG